MLKLYVDHRLGGIPRYYIANHPEHLMIVPPDMQKCAVFVARREQSGAYKYMGTAFCVQRTYNDTIGFSYLVTAKHIIAKARSLGLREIFLRVNTSHAFEWIRTDLSDWVEHPTDYATDVSVLPLPNELGSPHFDLLAIPIESAATDDVFAEWDIGVGNEVFITGLFVRHAGRQKNLPIIRMGNIALMPSEPIEVKILANYYQMEAYLIEGRSIGGLSGSPVWVLIDVETHLNSLPVPKERKPHRFYWLGLIHGHWDVEIRPDEYDIDEDDTVSKAEKVNMGIAIVVPATKILETIDHPDLVAKRQVEIENARSRNAPSTDDLDNDDVFTKEDFERALDDVMRRDDEKPDPESSETSE